MYWYVLAWYVLWSALVCIVSGLYCMYWYVLIFDMCRYWYIRYVLYMLIAIRLN